MAYDCHHDVDVRIRAHLQHPTARMRPDDERVVSNFVRRFAVKR